MSHLQRYLSRSVRGGRCLSAIGAGIVVIATQSIAFGQPLGSVPSEPAEALLESVIAAPTAENLRAWHDLLGSQPHVAGGSGDAAVIASIAATKASA